ncbi:MAG: hypothetical protein ACRDD9_16035, partial [Shewanella sp.]
GASEIGCGKRGTSSACGIAGGVECAEEVNEQGVIDNPETDISLPFVLKDNLTLSDTTGAKRPCWYDSFA